MALCMKGAMVRTDEDKGKVHGQDRFGKASRRIHDVRLKDG